MTTIYHTMSIGQHGVWGYEIAGSSQTHDWFMTVEIGVEVYM